MVANRYIFKPWLAVAVLLQLLQLPAQAYEDWIPFVENFDQLDYGQSYTTWRIATQGRWAYFAGQGGLLEFNGVSWHRYQMNNRSEVRGVMLQPEQQRILVGGENEFGYFKVGPSGALEYHCLSDSLSSRDTSGMGNVFDFYQLGGVTYARCDFEVIVMAGGKVTTITSSDKFFASALAGGTLYLATDHGLRVLAGNQFLHAQGTDVLDDKRVNAMVPYQDGLLVTTASSGLFFYDGTRVTPITTPADAILRDGVVCCAAMRGDRIAVGTIHFGVIVINLLTGDIEKYDDSCGLQSNMVQSVAFDDDGNLWAGQDCGISRVLLNSPYTSLYMAPRSYGLGYTALIDRGHLYMGTNRGAFYTDYPVRYGDRQTKLYGLDVPAGDAWYLYRHSDGDMLLMHDRGIFVIEDFTSHRVTDIEGVWSCIPVSGHADMLFVGAYQGVYLVAKRGGEWVKLGRIEGITEPCRYIRQTDGQHLKVYNVNTGTYQLYALDSTLLHVTGMSRGTERYVADGRTGGGDQLFYQHPFDHLLQADSLRTIVPFTRGFILYNKQKDRGMATAAMIEAIRLIGSTDSLVYRASFCDARPTPAIDYADNSIRIDFAPPLTRPTYRLLYRYRLNGGEWSEPAAVYTKEYSDLDEGRYTFQVEALMGSEVVSGDSISFTILPPWYRTWPAYLIFALIAAGVALMLWRTESRRVERKKAEAVKEKEQQVATMKIEIDKLEHDKMEQDLRYKSQEIANLAMSVARKNEMLQELKADILRVATRLQTDTARHSKQELLVINNKIDSNIESDELLRKFEEQYDQANNNFIQKLRQLHPNLSHNEVMMCVYLRMNMATKEIAPLLNLSVRGVESIRYRIRKKFGLDRENNLVDYMNRLTDSAPASDTESS